MRKAKTPPKRKPVPAGRRAAKRKAAKGAGARGGKVVAKSSTSAKAGKGAKVPGAAKPAQTARGGRSSAAAGAHAKAPARAMGTAGEKTGKKLEKTVGNDTGKKPASRPASKVVSAPAPSMAAPKDAGRSPARPLAGAPGVGAKTAPVAARVNHEAKDLKKVAAERPAAGSTSRHDGAGPATPSSDKPVEPAAPVGLPTPIASFTI